MSLTAYRSADRNFPEATDRHVRRVLGLETDERILADEIELTPSDFGGSHVIKPTGNLVSPAELLEIREEVLRRLAAVGLTLGSTMSTTQRNSWDRTVGAALLELVRMGPFQTYSSSEKRSDGDAWTYLTVHVFPEFPGWRFPGKKGASTTHDSGEEDEDEANKKVKPVDRVRGGRRNVLFRVWYRSFVLGSNYRLPRGAENLAEDELDNIFGRPSISRNHDLTRRIVDAVYRNQPSSTSRNLIVRELMKETRRRYSSIHFAALGDDLDEVIDTLWKLAEKRVRIKAQLKREKEDQAKVPKKN